MPEDVAPTVERILDVEVSQVGKYLLAALAGAVVGIFLGFALATLIPQGDTLPANISYREVEPEGSAPTATVGLDELVEDLIRTGDDDPDATGE